MVGPRASGSSSHIGEGKDNSASLSREFGVTRFEVGHQLVKKSLCCLNVSSIIVWNLRFEFSILFNGTSRTRSSIMIRQNPCLLFPFWSTLFYPGLLVAPLVYPKAPPREPCKVLGSISSSQPSSFPIAVTS